MGLEEESKDLPLDVYGVQDAWLAFEHMHSPEDGEHRVWFGG